MILWAVENKCHYYDLMGVPGNIEDENNPIYGLYRFKKGFGGEMWEFVGEFDMVYKPFWNWGFNLVAVSYTHLDVYKRQVHHERVEYLDLDKALADNRAKKHYPEFRKNDDRNS